MSIENLNWKKSKLQFENNNKKMMVANLKGNFTQNEVKQELKKLTESLKEANKIGSIGVAYHYKNINRYSPAIMNTIGNYYAIFDDAYYDVDHGDDRIDQLQFYVISNDDGKQKYIRAQKEPTFKDFFNNK